MKLKTNTPFVRSALIEILSIVIGVLLALAANEWNENRVHSQRASEAIHNVIQEIESNIKFMNIVNGNNRATLDAINNENGSSSEENKRQFIPGLQIQDTAWKTLLSTGVSEYIDYATIYEISAIYGLQDIYKSLGYQIIQSMSNNRALVAALKPGQSNETDNNLFLTDMMLIESVETALLASYLKTLPNLKQKYHQE